MDKKYTVLPTQNLVRKGDYMVQINPEYVIPKLKSKYLLLENEKGMGIQARYQLDDQLDAHTIRVDQTLRYALGINSGDDLIIRPIPEENRPGIWQRMARRVLGVQVNIVRVHQASFNDMEINLCRLSHESLQSINANDGDFIIVESPWKRMKIRALEMTPKIIAEIRQRARENDKKYRNCAKYLNVANVDDNSFDLPPILLDQDARSELNIDECAPVRIYRSLGNDAGKRMHLISIPLILTLIGALISFDFTSIFIKVGILVFGVVTILLLTFMDMKIK